MIVTFDANCLEEIMQLWLQTNIQAHHYIAENYWQSRYETVKKLLPQAYILLYKDAQSLKGFIGITDSRYIAGLFVDKQWQRQGIGKQLLDACKKQFAFLELDVYVKNTRAVRFYQQNGFTIAATNTAQETEHHMQWHSDTA